MTHELRSLRRKRETLETIDWENHSLDSRIVVGHGQILLEGMVGI